MCGRFYRTADALLLEDFFDAEPTGAMAAYQPRYNAAPTTTQLVIREHREGGREIVPMRWGLVGHRSAGPDPKRATFNARAETDQFKSKPFACCSRRSLPGSPSLPGCHQAASRTSSLMPSRCWQCATMRNRLFACGFPEGPNMR